MRLAIFVSAAVSMFAQRPMTLDDVARIATAMLDGDICQHIETSRSIGFRNRKDPRDPWAASDNYDVDAGAFTSTKKVLMRVARLCPSACDVNLWMPVKADTPRIQILIRNVNEMSQFWTWGALDQEIPAEMKRVLETGERVTVNRRPGMTSVLAPVYDSTGDIVGLVEAVSQTRPDPRENVK